MSLVPISNNAGLTLRQTLQANRKQQQSALAVFNHGLMSDEQVEVTRRDLQANREVVSEAAMGQLLFLRNGLALADGSAAAIELVVDNVSLLRYLDTRLIERRFGR